MFSKSKDLNKPTRAGKDKSKALKKLSILATVAIISFSAESFAESKGLSLSLNADSTLITNLPKSGQVTISGVVTQLNGNRKFTLADSAGKTIDVNTADIIDIKKGDTVSVNGTLDSEFAGFGKEINNATIGHGINLDSTRGDDLSFIAPASKKSNSAIENLPDRGMVEVSGIVSDVDGDKKFILTDSTGKTIDVHTKNDLKIKEGDSVKVIGEIESEALGVGEEIKASKVIKL